ncbi:hypothetical protein JRQ81_005788 [Phrynocephalus forsythii]|uniref:Ig-like domain-containing protein n=1 Tax=Phrynocephalus forsythii TaxID=171643 RepID=A0A9Q0XH05_9SAUR|nr:hypothetical protein JRQ81_005788 [Phrynocephalus forsythii]
MRLSCIVLFLGSYHPVNENRNQRQKESIRDQLGFQMFNYFAANLGFYFPGWLAKQQTLSRGQLRKPTISLRPNHEIFLGEQLSIYCRIPHRGRKTFYLQKEGNQQALNMRVNWLNEGIFTIFSAQKTDVGKYWCGYCFATYDCSSVSDVLYLNLTEVAYPKPSISVNPSEVVTHGESVSIHCKKEGLQTANFTLQKNLYKLLDTYKTIETKMDENKFPMTKVEYKDAGIYRCRYCSQSESTFYQRCSNYSDQVYINVTGYWSSKPFIQLTPSEESSPGSNVTIECQGPYNGLTFLLLKSNQVTASKETGQGRNSAKFHLSRVTSGDAGNYTCHYYLEQMNFSGQCQVTLWSCF